MFGQKDVCIVYKGSQVVYLQEQMSLCMIGAAVCQSNCCLLCRMCVCVAVIYYMKSVQYFQMRVPVWVSQRGGWEGHTHWHFSWCVRKISSMTHCTRGFRKRWCRVTSGAYFSTSCSLSVVLEAWQVQPLFQLLVPQPQLPPQRLTSRHRGKKTALVALSSSRRFTE